MEHQSITTSNAPQGSEVLMKPMFGDKAIPLQLSPKTPGTQLLSWAMDNRSLIEQQLESVGALLFRGFGVADADDFQQFAQSISSELVDYDYFRSSPRTKLTGRVYTSTEYPADRTIPLHNEMSYTRTWPTKIWFYCVKAAAQGGATPIGDSARVFDRIDPAVREKFMKHGVMYVRNYHEGVDLPYKEVFGTENPDEIRQFCKQEGIECEFSSKGSLRTKQICQAVLRHPKTGQNIWFNQAHLFHISRLDRRQAAALVALYGKDGVPRNAFYGDGSPIENSEMDVVRQACEQESVSFPWEVGDVLLLDNLKIAHGRDTFSGERKIVVAMADKAEAASFETH